MKRIAPIAALAVTGCAMTCVVCGAPGPQPRVRLHRKASVAVARVEENATAKDTVTVLERFIVKDAKLPSGPRPLREEDRRSFSLLKGGPMMNRNSDSYELSMGLWRKPEIFEDEARFKPTQTRLEFDLLRVKR